MRPLIPSAIVLLAVLPIPVAVYALDITGRGRRPGIERLTRVTGGGYPFHGRDLTAALRDIERENSGFYLLSYRSPSAAGYRRVEVRTANPELVARARSGYGHAAAGR